MFKLLPNYPSGFLLLNIWWKKQKIVISIFVSFSQQFSYPVKEQNNQEHFICCLPTLSIWLSLTFWCQTGGETDTYPSFSFCLCLHLTFLLFSKVPSLNHKPASFNFSIKVVHYTLVLKNEK